MFCPHFDFFLVGDTSRPEFYDACTALNEVARVTRFPDMDGAAAALADGSLVPHVIVLTQAYPGQFAATTVERLRAAAPLARIIALLGSWCEGEPRSGHPLPGVARVYWHEAAVRFRQEISRCSAAHSPWSLPATASDEERLLASVAAPLARGNGLVAIWTRRREMAELLADACCHAGYSTVWLHPRLPGRLQGAVAAIFDGDTLDTVARDELKQFAAHVSPARALVLLPAPRIQDVRAARTLGAEALGKPFRVDELLFFLGDLHAVP